MADVFRTNEDNFVRFEIVNVLEQSEALLGKLGNCDEMFRRLYAVILCNDPIARSLTLRAMGAIGKVNLFCSGCHN